MDRPEIRIKCRMEIFECENTLLLEVLLVPNASKFAKLSEPNASLAVLLEPNGSSIFVLEKAVTRIQKFYLKLMIRTNL